MSDAPLIPLGTPRASGPPAGGPSVSEAPLTWQEKLARLESHLAGFRSVVVAYSGGVDSSLVLRVAHEVLGARARGVIGRSDSYAKRELELALAQAASFGAEIEIVSTGELSDPNFRSNPTNRCYHCKSELYRELAEVATRIGADAVLDGTIVDDLGDWRPGRLAASERDVRSPLAELGFSKEDVRAAAAHFGLSSFDKPAMPCLASRIPYGTEITRENLSQVERGEELLRSLGFAIYRLRHFGDTARIEVPVGDLPRLMGPEMRERVTSGLKSLGFRFITVDLDGFRSGNLNRSIVPAASGPWPEPGEQAEAASRSRPPLIRIAELDPRAPSARPAPAGAQVPGRTGPGSASGR